MNKFVGIQTQIRRNNQKSVLLLMGFPLLVLGAVYLVTYFFSFNEFKEPEPTLATERFIGVFPWVIGIVLVWFLIAYFANSKMISLATGAKTLKRKENLRVYNLVENLCMSVGMKMPKVQVIESQALNAYASGLKESDYTVTLTRGIIEHLNDDELEGVIAHELMHIRNQDVRLLVISIIFVGIFSFVVQLAFRNILYGSMSRRNNKDSGKAIIIIMIVAFIAYIISLLFKFALSRKREYMADSGAAEMTRKPWALAAALKKISPNHHVNEIKSEDVQDMFIENTPKDGKLSMFGGIGGLFATHPPIEKRIQFLEQF